MKKFAAPPIRTGFLGNPPKTSIGGEQNVPSYAYESWFQAISTALSIPSPPATSTSAGTANQLALDANFLYVCVATNTWKRVALASF